MQPITHVELPMKPIAPIAPNTVSATSRIGTLGAIATISALIIASLAITGCSSPNAPRLLSPYRIDVPQGNFISEPMTFNLREGMTRDQVRGILGTPLLVDPFRNDRWDYVFEIRRSDGVNERRRFSVIFKGDQLASWGGDPLPQQSGEGILPSKSKR
jgi:outer membrane protein assembly factor BamE